MKLNPQQAPLYGECVLTVCLDDEEVCWTEEEEREGGEAKAYYLLFSGSNQRHLTTTLRVNHVMLQAICPAHDAYEQVLVTLCLTRSNGQVDPRSQQCFTYVPDLALDMARFLLNDKAPQGAMLLDDHQVPLKECERLDLSLALALQHLTSSHRRMEPGTRGGPQTDGCADIAVVKGALTGTPSPTDTNVNATLDGSTVAHMGRGSVEHNDTSVDTEIHKSAHACTGVHTRAEMHIEPLSDHFIELENHIDLSQWGRQWTTLLHFAASRGLRRVALFLLRQPEAREALRQEEALGDTLAHLAERKGHHQLAGLLKRFEASLEGIQEESECRLRFYPGGRAFQCHPGLGTYTLTLPSRRETEKTGAGEGDRVAEERRRSESAYLVEEIEELRRLIWVHTEQKANLDCFALCNPAPVSEDLTLNPGLCDPAGEAWLHANGQPESQGAEEQAVAALENRCKVTVKLGCEQNPTVVGITPCITGSPRPIREEAAGRPTPAVNRHNVRNRKKQKRTLKSTGNNKSVTETLEKAINYSANITGSNSESLEILSPKEPIEEGKYTSPPKPELTQFPIVQLSRTSCKAGHTSSGKVAVVTSIAEKQEGGNSELGLETSPRKTASEELTAKQTDQNHLTRETCTQAECDLLPVFTTERKAKMGQGQSEDSQEPTRSNSSDCSPSLNHRGSPKPTAGMLWPDGGLTSAVGGSDELDPETSANTVWYQDESTDLPPANGVRLNSQRKDSLIQSIWYDDNVVNHNLTQSEIGQRGSTDHNERVVNYSQALDLNARDPLGHDPGFQVSASTLSQVSDSGKQPALSHVPCAQRQEASGTQRDKGGREEGEAERKERGADIGQQRKSVGDHRRRTYSGESCHRDEGERGSKQGVQETADKGRKKRRRNRGRRGVAEAKLSSSSSTESHILIDTQADADPGDPLYTEGTAGTQTSPAAHSVTGRAVSQSRCSSESVPREEADAGTMRLPGQTESTSSDCGRPSAADANMDSNVPELDLARLDSGSKKVTSSEGPESTEFPNVTVPTECESLIQPVELKSRVVNIENSTELLGTKDFSVAVDDDVVPTELLDFSFTNEQDSGHADTDESKQAFALAGLSEQSTFIASMGSINPLPMETFETKSKSVDQFKLKAAQLLESPETERGFMEDVQSKDAVEHSILLEEAADLSLLQKQEGRTDDAGKAHLGHCFGHTESPGDGPSENKTSEVKERETRENHEEMGEETRGAQIKERLVSEERLGGERAGYKESCMWNKEQREREEGINSRGEVHPTHTVKEQNKNCREGEHGSMEGDNALCYKEELAAAAVAIVTVAVASALAHVELSQRLSVGLAEGEVSEEPSSKEHSHIPSSVVASRDHKLLINGRLQSVSERQVTSDSHAELTTAAAGKDHASNELSDRDESSPLGDKASTAKEDQLGKASDFRPQALLCSKAQHDGELDLKKGTDSLCSAIIGTHCSEYDNLLQTDGILLIRQHTLTKQSGVLVQVDLNKSTQISPVNTVQVISEATTMENLCLDLDALAIEAISPVQANIKASRNLDEVLDIQLNSQSSTESDSQFCQDGPVPCPVVDTGQGDAIKLLDVFESAGNPELKDGKEDSSGEHNCSQYKEPLCNSQDQERSAGDPLVTHVQETECHEASGSQSTSSAGAPRELGSQTRRRGSEDVDSDENKGGIDNAGAAEEQGSRFESGKCCSGLPHSESQHKSPPMAVGPQDDQVSCSSLPHSESQHKSSPMAVGPQNDQAALEMSLPVSPGDSFSGTTSTDPLTPEVGTSQPTPETSVAATPLEVESGTFQRQDIHCALVDERDGVLEDNGGNWVSLDTVDGCKQMEGMRDGEETRRITALEEESCQGAHVQPPETIPDGPASPEIQRERETFYPVQPCPEPCVPPSTPLATVKDLGPSSHGERAEESVSVCALEGHAGAANDDGLERLTPNAELDDLVFKKPAEPVSRLEFRDKRVRSSWSSTDDSSTQGPPSVSSLPSQDTMSLGTGESAPPWSPGGLWKSESEEGGVVCAGVEGVGATVGEEAERNDHLPDNLVTSAVLGAAAARASIRSSVRSLSPLRRHSWEPGRSNAAGPPGDADPALRSSPGSLPVEVRRAKPPLHRRSMSWCPSNLPRPDQEHIDNRSYSLEGLEVEQTAGRTTCPRTGIYEREERPVTRVSRLDSQERGGGSLVSLTEEEQEGEASSIDSQNSHRVLSLQTSCPTISHHPTLTKSISMVAISQRETDANGRPRVKRRISFSLSISPLLPKTRSIFSIGSFSSDEEAEGGRFGPFSTTPGSLEYSICEEEPGPLRSDSEGRGGGGGGGVVGGTKVSRTFSYLRSKMSKKNKGSDKEKKGEKEREVKEKEKRPVNGHLFSPTSPSTVVVCHQCARPLLSKEVFLCTNCGAHVHKNCRENLLTCAKGKMKQQSLVPEAVPGSAVNLRNKSTSSASSISSSSSSSLSRDRWSTVTSPEDHMALPFPRRNPSILSFSTHSNLSKSISTSNIAGLDEVPLKGLKFLSQSTDNLHQGSKVNASTESLTDEGTEMMDSQLMGEFENDVKELEADSWSATVDKKFLKLHKKDEVKRQDVIYELYQTELHHVRTLRIMSEVYYKGIQKELQLDTHTLDKVFPVLDDLLDTHTHFLTLLLERRRTSMLEKRSPKSFLIQNIGDVLANQFSGCNADRMKKVYGKFCSRHYEAVNLYKELHAKDKRFQALIKRMMSSSIVRRLSIPECILLVTQRITKYPVLIQRILQHTKDTDEDHACVSQALRCVKELIAAVDSKVNEQEKKKRLKEVYSRTDSKSIMRMKSGQMFAREDLVRGRRLLHDGTLQLKNSAGRLKDVHAMLLSDVLVFLQEKDQKYVFASLDQRSTVISLQKLIVREVANEERGLFLITAGIERPEMVEVLASSKEERNTWMSIIQDAMHCIEKEEDEGVPSETEEDRRQQENRAKEMRELLRRKDEQIISLLEEKVHIFKDLCDCNSAPDDTSPPIRERMLFRATPDDVTKGEPIIKDALKEVESLHTLVNSGVGGAGVNTAISLTGGSVGPVCLPRRAETFGGFDSHQMNSSKSGEKEEGDDALDLRRTESDSVLKKGANTSLQMLLKRNNEQVQHSVGHLHDLLTSLQAVVVQQDSFIEDQRQALSERLVANPSSRHSSSSSSSLSSTSSSSRPSSLIEQEKQRSLERQRQEAASLQKQQAAHQEERRRREREWEARERGLSEREARLQAEEEEAARLHRALEEEREELHKRKEEYQRDLERLREAQRRLERDREAVRRETERIEGLRSEESGQLQKYQRTPSTTSEDSLRFHSSGSLDQEPRDASEQAKGVQLSSSAPTKEPFLRIGSKRMGKNFNPFSSSSSSSASKPQAGEKESQLPTRLLQLAKAKKDKKDKKKKGKGEREEIGQAAVMSEPQNDGEIFFC